MTGSNSLSLQGRVALITGGSRGIGRAITKAMAEAGADVMVNYVSDEESASKTADEIRALGRKAMTFQADVADADVVNAMVGAAVEGLGKVDILVCNAGIIRRDSHVYEADLEEFREVIENHIMGAFNCVQAVLPNMRQQPRGDIQLISSTNVRMLPLGPDLLQRRQGRCGGDGPGAFQRGAGARYQGERYRSDYHRDGHGIGTAAKIRLLQL